MWPLSSAEPIAEYEASDEIDEIYHDIRQTLRVSGINLVFRALAPYSQALPTIWHEVAPLASKQSFEEASDNLRSKAVQAAASLGALAARDAVRAGPSQSYQIEMDGLKIETAAVVAHDIGGGVALRLATLHPGRVSRLCLLNTVCYDSWPIEAMLQLGHPEARRKLSASSLLTLLRQALKQGFASSPDAALLDGLLAPYATEVGKLSLIRNAAALNTNLTTELTPLLPRLAIPTLILWGEEDVFQPVRFGERLARDIPHARLVRIKDARHFLMIDQPEEVARHVWSFLTTGTGTAMAA